MHLDHRQQSCVVDLLSRLSPDTVDTILSRFDEETGERIRRDLNAPTDHRGGSSVITEFAEFLYDPLPDSVPARSNRRFAASPKPGPEPVTVKTIMELSDESIDALLASISPELTVQMLCCCRESFIHRVLSRLSPEDANQVVQQINASESPGFAQMKSVQQRYCQIVSDLLTQGLIELIPQNRS